MSGTGDMRYKFNLSFVGKLDDKTPEFLPQQVVNDKYVVLSKIGHGAYGKVYETVTKENRYEKLVLKVQDCTIDSRSYQRELEVMRQCNGSQGFPYLLDDFSEIRDGQVFNYLVMVSAGETYLDVLKRKNFELSPSNVLRIGWMIFRALTTLHQLQLVHRDIHYGNIMMKLDSAGNVVVTLIDFGRSIPESTPNNKLRKVLFQTSLSYARGNPYTRFDDFMSMGYLLGPSVGVHPFLSETRTAVQTKEDFHADPLSYFAKEETQWIASLIMLFERQREEGYSYDDISQLFHSAIPDIEPESSIEYEVLNGLLYIN